MTINIALAPIASATRRTLIAAGAVALVVASCAGDDGDDAGDTRALDDVLGPVDVPAQPERIVADSHFALAHLWTLGVVPVGAVVAEGIDASYIGDGVTDVPSMVADDGWTLDIEAALAEGSDLIVAVGADYNLENCERYKEAIATYCYTDGWATEEDIEATLAEIAVAVDREGAAADTIAQFDARKAELTERVAATDLPTKKVGLVRFAADGFIGVRVEDLGATLIQELGMQVPDWEGELIDGYLQLSLETLEVLNAADVLLITLDDDADPDAVGAFQAPVWDLLEPVANNQAHIVGAWNGADFPQLELMLDDIEVALVVPAEQS